MNDLREKVEILDGSRGSGAAIRRRAAVRRADIDALLSLQPLRAREASGPMPTAEEYAVLLDDLRRVHACLDEIAKKLQGHLL